MNLSSLQILSKYSKSGGRSRSFDDLGVLEFYEDEKGRVYVKTLEHNGKDKIVLTDKKTAPEEIVRQLFCTTCSTNINIRRIGQGLRLT